MLPSAKPCLPLHAVMLSALSGMLLMLPGCASEVTGNEVTITAENFEDEVVQSHLPVLLDFWAPWCGPCQKQGPVVAQLSLDYDGRLKVGKVNIDDESELADRFEVAAIPMIILLQDGEPIASQPGYASLADLTAWVDSHLPAVNEPESPAGEQPTGDRL